MEMTLGDSPATVRCTFQTVRFIQTVFGSNNVGPGRHSVKQVPLAPCPETGGFLDLGPGNFYYPGGAVTLGAGATAPFYDSAQGSYIKLFGNDYFSGGDILIASGHSYGSVDGQGTGGTITLATSTAYGGNYPPPRPIVFKIGPTERFRVNSNGNLGIGTNTPGAPLEVRGAGAGPTFKAVNANSLAGQFDGNVTINGNLTVSGTSSTFSCHVRNCSYFRFGTNTAVQAGEVATCFDTIGLSGAVVGPILRVLLQKYL